MPTSSVLRIVARGLIWSVVIGPAFFFSVLLIPLLMLGRAGQIPAVVAIGMVKSAPVTVACGVIGIVTAMLVGIRKGEAWTPKRWLFAGMIGGAVIGLVARLALAVSDHPWMEMLERIRWTFIVHLVPGAAIGGAFTLTSLQDLEALSKGRITTR